MTLHLMEKDDEVLHLKEKDNDIEKIYAYWVLKEKEWKVMDKSLKRLLPPSEPGLRPPSTKFRFYTLTLTCRPPILSRWW